MNPDSLKNLMHAQPFQPLVLNTADQRKIAVLHPDFISLSAAGRTALIFTEGDYFEILDVFLLVGATTQIAPSALSDGQQQTA